MLTMRSFTIMTIKEDMNIKNSTFDPPVQTQGMDAEVEAEASGAWWQQP